MDAHGWNERYADSELVWSGEPNVFVAAHLAGRAPGEALDLGAGEGRNAVWLALQGWDVTAVDFSAVGLEKARRMAFEAGVELATVISDVEKYEPVAAVDLVLLSYLQIPDEHQRRLLRRVTTWLRPEGIVLVVAHDKSNTVGGPSDPVVCYSVDQTVEALDGMRVEVAEIARRETPAGVALDTVVLAVRD